MAMAAALVEQGNELFAKNLRFVEEEIKIHEHRRPQPATKNRPRLDLRTMVLREYGEPGSVPTLVDAPHADLHDIVCPVHLLAGAADDITTPEQVLNAAKYVGTPADRIVCKTVPGGHIGLFMGARTLADHWPAIARWIYADRTSSTRTRLPRTIRSASLPKTRRAVRVAQVAWASSEMATGSPASNAA